MLLELGKGVSFFLALFSLAAVAAIAFFSPGLRWRERLLLMLVRTLLAALLCTLSGIVFAWPAGPRPDARQAIATTLPVQLFLYAIPTIAALSALNWYFLCGCQDWATQHFFACR